MVTPCVAVVRLGDGAMRELAGRARRFESRIPCRPDVRGATGEAISGRDGADGTV